MRISESRKIILTCSMHGEIRNAHKILISNLKGKGHFGGLDTGGRIILNGPYRSWFKQVD
jgi:hypothetical protein